MVETDQPETDGDDSYPLPARLNELARSSGGDIESIRSNADYLEFRREVFQFAENFKPNDAGQYSALYHRLVQDSSLSEREAQVATMKIAGITHAAILLFYEIMDRETADEKDYPTSITTINEYSQRAKAKYRKAIATVDLLEPIFDVAWECPKCGNKTLYPETDGDAETVLEIKCPSCGFTDYQDGPSAGYVEELRQRRSS